MRKILFITLFLSLSLSCSKKHHDEGEKYTAEEMTKLLADTGAIVDKEVTGINFADYSIGVNKINSKAMEYKRLGFYVIEFEAESQARKEALRLNQYYSRNYLFDRTNNEPVLEDYLIINFKAINPARSFQRKPKVAPVHSGAAPAPAPAQH